MVSKIKLDKKVFDKKMFFKLIRKIKNIFKAWANLIRLNNLPNDIKSIVFYAENSSDWVFLNPVAESLKLLNKNIIRITSDPDDNLLSVPYVYYIGSGGARTVLFRLIKADAFIMTLTDLGSYYLKKSLYPVHYFYIFHSIVSTHRIYREHAFDSYDTILCVGSHQIKAIRARERIYGLAKKNLEEHGYAKLDNIINKKKLSKINNNDIVNNVVISPTWGDGSLVKLYLERLIQILISNNFNVTLRLHPMTLRHYPNISKNLLNKYANSGKFFFDPYIENVDTLLYADIMISDWSGASIEYAFGTNRPVIFIDTKPKINNNDWKKINLPCLEETIRKDIGKIVSINELENIPKIIKEILNNIKLWSNNINNIRDRTVFNVGNSGTVGAKIICKTLGFNNN